MSFQVIISKGQNGEEIAGTFTSMLSAHAKAETLRKIWPPKQVKVRAIRGEG